MESIKSEEILENYDDLELGPQSESDNLFILPGHENINRCGE